MSWQPTRDLVGYGANPPDPKWPNGARIAVNFVVNYEEGSEPSMQDGEGYSENGLTESSTSSQGLKGRDLAAEGMFEFGSRVGFWRIMRAFQERGLPLTVFGCALALERNKPAAEATRHPIAEMSETIRWALHHHDRVYHPAALRRAARGPRSLSRLVPRRDERLGRRGVGHARGRRRRRAAARRA